MTGLSDSSAHAGEGRGPRKRVVVHVVPTAVARGAQVYARALVDRLDSAQQRHLLVAVFGGEHGIAVDEWAAMASGPAAGVGLAPVVAARLRSLLGRLEPDVVVAHGGDALKYAAFARRSAPLAYYAIGTLSAPALGGARRLMWKMLVRRADAVAAVSDEVADELRKVLGVTGRHLVVVANGRDETRFVASRRQSQDDDASYVPHLVFVGRLVAEKRPGRFLEVVRTLRERGLQVRASVIGDGPMRSEVGARASSVGVELRGQLGDVSSALREADLLVFTSLPAGEGMPGVLIEAGLCGLPAVATAVPGASTVVESGRTGFVVGVGDFEGLVESCERLIVDRDMRLAMGSAARERCAGHFSLASSAARWSNLLEALMPDGP